jgi:phthalate 4,5-dioxygenase oxygenase subunit
MADPPRLDEEDFSVLAEVARGTTMGELLRRYWVPALLSEELPEPGGPQIRTRLLGEDLIAFRSPSGEVGLIGEFCSHRGASLYFGRVEDGGLRCSYHGWKYDACGRCIEMPNEPSTSTFKNRIRHPAYPCVERGGIVWTYMGPEDARPELPQLEYLTVPESHQFVSKRMQHCHWTQAQEADIDSSHVPWLHRELILEQAERSDGARCMLEDTAPQFHVLDRPYGLLVAARRVLEGREYWRVNHWFAPWYTVIPMDGPPYGLHAWIPIDRERCWVYGLSWHPERPFTREETDSWKRGEGHYAELIPGTYLPVRNASNDWSIDRTAQRTGHVWSGVRGNQEQDDAITGGMGPLYDRTREHLLATDAAVVAVRRSLVDRAHHLAQAGAADGVKETLRGRAVAAFREPGAPPADWLRDLAPLCWPEVTR